MTLAGRRSYQKAPAPFVQSRDTGTVIFLRPVRKVFRVLLSKGGGAVLTLGNAAFVHRGPFQRLEPNQAPC